MIQLKKSKIMVNKYFRLVFYSKEKTKKIGVGITKDTSNIIIMFCF
jgi:hypothetical protein